jgi:hypothetical protein
MSRLDGGEPTSLSEFGETVVEAVRLYRSRAR